MLDLHFFDKHAALSFITDKDKQNMKPAAVQFIFS
jgi:hypothetical protein